MKVLMFGSFDIIHEGHKNIFKQAAALGDELYVLVSRDETIRSVKNREPVFPEDERVRQVQAIPEVTKAFLGSTGDKYAVLDEVQPDIIALGYDQTFFVDKLALEIQKRGMHTKIVRLKAYHPEKYKSSLLRKQNETH